MSAQGGDRAEHWDEGAVLSVNRGLLLASQSDASTGKKEPSFFFRPTWVLSSQASPFLPVPMTQAPCILVDDFSVSHSHVSPRWRPH